MLQEDYVSFEQAKRLKELGFPQTSWYRGYNYFEVEIYNEVQTLLECVAPNFYQVQKWLREEKDFILLVDKNGGYDEYYYHYETPNTIKYSSEKCYDTYEETLSKGIDKAIELLENENNYLIMKIL